MKKTKNKVSKKSFESAFTEERILKRKNQFCKFICDIINESTSYTETYHLLEHLSKFSAYSFETLVYICGTQNADKENKVKTKPKNKKLKTVQSKKKTVKSI